MIRGAVQLMGFTNVSQSTKNQNTKKHFK